MPLYGPESHADGLDPLPGTVYPPCVCSSFPQVIRDALPAVEPHLAPG